MKLRNISKEVIPFIEVFISALIILIVISINRGVLYENKLKTMEYPADVTAIGTSINMLTSDSWNPWEIYSKLIEESTQVGVITHYIDYFNELINAPNRVIKNKEALNSLKNVKLIGTVSKYFDYFHPNLRAGRYFSVDEETEHVCLIGEDLAKRLFGTIETSIGQTIELPYIYYKGYRKEQESQGFTVFNNNSPIKTRTFTLSIIGVLDGTVKLPARTIQFFGEPVKQVNVYADNSIILPANTIEGSPINMDFSSTIWTDIDYNQGMKLATELSNNNPDLIFTVNPDLSTYFQSSLSEKVALLILNAFALLVFIVAGMGIMGIQLIAVGRRREEIGLRMAIGAHRRKIATMIMKETLISFLLPSIAGIFTGLISLSNITAIIGIPFLIDINTVLIGLLVSALFAACVSLYPALKAASIDPIHAMGRTMGFN